MSWLLKIVEGPMKGAEIALVDGLKVKVGSGDACDIVIADRSLDEVAFDLDVTAGGVTLMRPSGVAQAIAPFEVFTFGTTALAVGPAESKWKDLVWPKPAEAAGGAASAGDSGKDGASGKSGEADDPGKADNSVEAGDSGSPGDSNEPRATDETGRSRRPIGCLVWLIVLILLGVAVWYFWPRVVEKCPQAEDCRVAACGRMHEYWTAGCEKAAEWARRGYAWVGGKAEKPVPQPVVLPTLEEIAADHGLQLVSENGVKTLKGNCVRRTERYAIRALALASDSSVKFDLTDDESLKTAADELLFVVTEGAVKAVAASNRVVTLTGSQPTLAQFEKVVRSLNADVPGIERLETTGVRIGRTAKNADPSNGTDAAASDETAPAAAPKAKIVARRDYPIAGILVAPYPCVVMRNGLRLTVGAQLGNAVIEKIEADRLHLRDGAVKFEWKP